MTDTEVRTIVHSPYRNTWMLDDAQYGPELTRGQPVLLMLGGAMITGHIEVNQYEYYFRGDDGSVCGLCRGMRVRRL